MVSNTYDDRKDFSLDDYFERSSSKASGPVLYRILLQVEKLRTIILCALLPLFDPSNSDFVSGRKTAYYSLNRIDPLHTHASAGRAQDSFTLYESNDSKLLATAYDFHVEEIWPRMPEITTDDLKLFLEQIAQTNPKALAIDPCGLIYGATVKELVESRFADRLYTSEKK